MLTLTKKGLYCRAGNFYIDPMGAVDHAVITHAHSDHARKGSRKYYCTRSGTELLRCRLGSQIVVANFNFGEVFSIGGVQISFHPAGHILGSAQVRLEYGGEVWVASGDYKREYDSTCESFESVECDVFVTEATFGTPAYCWKKEDVGKQIFDWWKKNSDQGINSVLFAYALGKTQRVLGALTKYIKNQSVYCHPAATALNLCYLKEGVILAPTKCLAELKSTSLLAGELLIVPQGFLKTDYAKVLGGNFKAAFASGWMAQRNTNYDEGFLMSDHADWNDLVRTVLETKAQQVYVQHRGQGALVKHLRTLGIRAFADSKLVPENPAQLTFF